MSANQPSVAGEPGSTPSNATPGRSFARVRWLAWAGALVVGIGAGSAAFLLHRSSAPAVSHAAPPLSSVATWPAGARPAPDFRLTDQHGTPFTLRSLRGRPVLVTFIDPLCRNLCPLEAKVLTQAVRGLPAAQRPAIVSVSVNPWADSPVNFREDAVKWRLDDSWRWGVGTHAQLAPVWQGYHVGVLVATKKIAGVTVREISHTEASYLVDASGHERALFLYPFRAEDVAAAVQRLG